MFDDAVCGDFDTTLSFVTDLVCRRLNVYLERYKACACAVCVWMHVCFCICASCAHPFHSGCCYYVDVFLLSSLLLCPYVRACTERQLWAVKLLSNMHL